MHAPPAIRHARPQSQPQQPLSRSFQAHITVSRTATDYLRGRDAKADRYATDACRAKSILGTRSCKACWRRESIRLPYFGRDADRSAEWLAVMRADSRNASNDAALGIYPVRQLLRQGRLEGVMYDASTGFTLAARSAKAAQPGPSRPGVNRQNSADARLTRTFANVRTEMSLRVLAYNLKRVSASWASRKR